MLAVSAKNEKLKLFAYGWVEWALAQLALRVGIRERPYCVVIHYVYKQCYHSASFFDRKVKLDLPQNYTIWIFAFLLTARSYLVKLQTTKRSLYPRSRNLHQNFYWEVSKYKFVFTIFANPSQPFSFVSQFISIVTNFMRLVLWLIFWISKAVGLCFIFGNPRFTNA